jgi:hypothetical protein
MMYIQLIPLYANLSSDHSVTRSSLSVQDARDVDFPALVVG